MAAHFADQIAVMHKGKVVECGKTETVVRAPQHSVTENLLSIARRSQMLPPVAQVI